MEWVCPLAAAPLPNHLTQAGSHAFKQRFLCLKIGNLDTTLEGPVRHFMDHLMRPYLSLMMRRRTIGLSG